MEKPIDNVVEIKRGTPADEAPTPEIRSQMTLVLFADGSFQCDGPYNDRIMFHGMLAMAAETEHDNARNVIERARKFAEARAKEPAWKRIIRQAREKALVRKQQEAKDAAEKQAAAEKK